MAEREKRRSLAKSAKNAKEDEKNGYE